jgi:hypothetical protein
MPARASTDCVITNNIGQVGADYDVWGGGVQCVDSAAVFTKCTFKDNIITGGVSYGGALCARRDDEAQRVVKLISCLFFVNSSGHVGGAVAVVDGGALEATNCLFRGNVVDPAPGSEDNGGGAIEVDGANGESTATLINCTMVGNDGADSGGGYLQVGNTVNSYMKNCILWDNLADSGAQILIAENDDLLIEYTDIEDKDLTSSVDGPVTWLSGNIDADPNFEDTINCRLECNSACSNKAKDTNVPADAFDVDTDGNTTEKTADWELQERIIGTLPDSDTWFADMGAYEIQSICCPEDVNQDGVVNRTDVLLLLSPPNPCHDCPEDVVPIPCGDNQITSDDITYVNDRSGTTCNCFGGSAPFGGPDEQDLIVQALVQACIESCGGRMNASSTASMS